MSRFDRSNPSNTYGPIGSLVGGAIPLARILSCPPAADPTAQVVTITVVADPDDSTQVTIGIQPYGADAAEQISDTGDSAETQADMVAGIAAAINANSRAAGAVAVTTTSSTVVLTDRTPGANATTVTEVLDAGADISIATTTAGADQATLTYGDYVPLTASSAYVGQLVASEPSTLAGPLLSLAITHASATYTADILVSAPGEVDQTYELSFASGGSAALTDDAAEAALTALFGSTVVTVANPSTGVVTVRWPLGYVISVSEVTASAGAMAATITASAAAPRSGIVLCDESDSSDTLGSMRTTVRPGTAASILLGGGALVVVADPGAAVTAGDPVWIESSTGLPKASAAPGRYRHPSHVWHSRNHSGPNATTVAVVEAL